MNPNNETVNNNLNENVNDLLRHLRTPMSTELHQESLTAEEVLQLSANSCKKCRSGHRKCDRLLPSCSRCRKRGTPCVYEILQKKKRKRRKQTVKNEEDEEQEHKDGKNKKKDSTDAENLFMYKQPKLDVSVQQPELNSSPYSLQLDSVLSLQSNGSTGDPHRFMMLMGTKSNEYSKLFNSSDNKGTNNTIDLNDNFNNDFRNINSNNEILQCCLKLLSPQILGMQSYSHFFKEFQVPFSNSSSSSQSNFNNRGNLLDYSSQVQSLDEFLNEKATTALWYASQAVFLQHAPSIERSPYVDTALECRIFDRALKKIFFSMIIVDRDKEVDTDWRHIMCRFPREQLLQMSKSMYTQAESILLDPKIFPYIGKHMTLAQTCCCLCFYLLVNGERSEEAEIFLKAVKLYAETEESVLNINLEAIADMNTKKMLRTRQIVVQGLMDCYSSMKSVLWYNAYAPKLKNFYTMESLEKFVKLSLQSVYGGNQYSNEARPLLAKQAEGLKRLQSILESESSPKTKLYNFLMTCQELRNDLNNVPNEKHFVTMWKIYTYTFEVFALEIAAVQLHLEGSNGQLHDTQVKLANEISREWFACLPIVMLSGARSMNLLKFITRVHIEHSDNLINNLNQKMLAISPNSTNAMIDALNFLQTDIIILDAIHDKYGISMFKELSDQLKKQEKTHKECLTRTAGLWINNSSILVTNSNASPLTGMSSLLQDQRLSPMSSIGITGMDFPRIQPTTSRNLLDLVNMETPTQVEPLQIEPLNLGLDDSFLFMDFFNWQSNY